MVKHSCNYINYIFIGEVKNVDKFCALINTETVFVQVHYGVL